MADTPIIPLQPFDQHNKKLQSNVHPDPWTNPSPKKSYHLVVIGAGTAGLVTAAGAAGLGARVALVERELMGGDCLNVGCVPSKAIISASRAAAAVADAERFGVKVPAGTTCDFAHTMRRMRRLRADISPVDSAKRFSDMGIDVFFGDGKFQNGSYVHVTAADGSISKLNYKKAVIASGARAAAPPIEGLETVDYLTNENLFSLTELPKRFGIVGSGPIGSEMAQAFARLGSEVFLFERGSRIMTREDADAAKIVQDQFAKDGVHLLLNSHDMKIAPSKGDQISVTVTQNGTPQETMVDQLLIAVGRAPNVESLDLQTVGVKYDKQGIEVDDYLRTSNPSIYAAGDVCSKLKFTHAADFQARIVIQNSLFAIGPWGRKKSSDLVIPWATYTSPEIAHVGMSAQDAQDAGIKTDTYVQSFEHLDRAILEGVTEGFVKIHTRQGSDKIVGATIVAPNAGDMISEISVAMTNGLGLAKIGSSIHPYPTQAEAIRKLGDQYNKKRLTPLNKTLLGLLMRFNAG